MKHCCRMMTRRMKTTSLAPGADEDQPDAQLLSNNPTAVILQCLLLKPTGRITLWLDILHKCVTSRKKCARFEIHFNNLTMVNFFNALNVEIVFFSYVGLPHTTVCPDSLTKLVLLSDLGNKPVLYFDWIINCSFC